MQAIDSDSDCVAIVLSTYNGSAFIADQINAISRQTHTNWHCYLRDDGSKDNTLAVVKPLIANDKRFILIYDDDGNLGLNNTHYRLISLTSENYVALCDQDDVWDDNKIEVSLNELKNIETNDKIPALISTDSIVVDSKLVTVNAKFIGKRGKLKGLNGILFANNAQGGSIMFNRSLKKTVLANPPQLPYDYHIAILAEMVGVRAFIPQTLLKYRQHDTSSIALSNAETSTKHVKPKHSISLLGSLSLYKHMKHDFLSVKINHQVSPLLEDYFYLFEGKNRFKKLYILFKNRYPFYRRKDFLSFAVLLLKNQDLKSLSV